MKEKIKSYVDDIFIDAPDSDKTRDIKEEMCQNLIERYEDLVAEGKSESAAYNAVISGVGDVSELVDGLRKESGEFADDAIEEAHIYTREETERRERDKSKFAILSAISIALYILCAVPVVVLDAVIGNDIGDAIGVMCLLAMVAVATAIRIYISKSKSDALKAYESREKSAKEATEDHEDKRGKKKKEKDHVKSAISGILWPVTGILYIGVSFWTGMWGITWMMFLIAAAIDNVSDAIVDLVRTSKKGNDQMTSSQNAESGRVYKRRWVVSLVIWTVVLVCLVGVFCASIMNGGGAFAIFGSGYNYSDADSFNVGNAEYTGELTDISINWIDGDVRVEVYDGDEIIVADNYSGDSDFYQTRSKLENGKLTVYYCDSGVSMSFHSINKELTLKIPKSVVSIGNLNAEIVSGDLDLKLDANIDRMKVETVSGDLIYTGSGRVNYVNINGVSGNISLKGDVQNLDVDTVSDKLDLYHTGEKMPASINIDGIFGDMTFSFSEATVKTYGIQLKLNGLGGDIEYLGGASLPASTHSKRELLIGTPSEEYTINGISGNVTVKIY